MRLIITGISLMVMCSQAFAAVGLKTLVWQTPAVRQQGQAQPRYTAASALKISDDQSKNPKLRLLLAVANSGTHSVDGIVLHCALSLRLVDIKNPDKPAIWTVPVWMDERRVSIIKPGETKNVYIPNVDFNSFTKRLKRTGFWPDAARMSIMAEPRAGDDLQKNIIESEIKIER